MNFARVLTAGAACVVVGAAVAACSGSFGSGTGLPNTMASPNFGAPSAAPSPATQSSVVLTYGESTSFQSLPDVGGYGGAIAFPKAPEPTAAPSPKSRAKNATPEPAATAVAIAIGAKLSIVKPDDGPDLNFESGKGKKKKTREHPARALAYITLLPTHDATLESFPRIALDVPRDIASQYRDGEFGLALWNSGEKDLKYRLAVAELDTTATPPPAKVVTVASTAPSTKPISTATPTARPSGSPGATATAGAAAAPSAAPTLPPQRLLFAGTASTLKLVANRPAVFALYALPHPSTSTAAPASAASSSAAPASAASSSPAPAKTQSP